MSSATRTAVARRFVEVLLRSRVVLQGDFTLKSGRKSSYFIDFGALEAPDALYEVGHCYAQTIVEEIGIDNFDVVFGPSYKGISLAVATAIALVREYGADKPYCFNRKDEKDHGEGGLIVGRKPVRGDRIVIVDDVITDGGTKYEMVEFLQSNTDAEIVGVVVGVDRSEPGTVEAFKERLGIPLLAITDFATIQAIGGPIAPPA